MCKNKMLRNAYITSLYRALLLIIQIMALVFFIKPSVTKAVPQTIVPGVDWKDTSGNLIEAHGAGIIHVGNTYYWFGEDKSGKNVAYVNVYSSNDLVNWTFKNHALPRQSSGDLGPNRVVERPKVIFDNTTNKYVMYMHIDSGNYGEAKIGVATSSVVDGVYTYQHSFQPNGQQSRDVTIFQDTDGIAYVIYSSNNGGTINTPLRISHLSSDYMKASGEVYHFKIGDHREAPAVVKVGKTYFMLTSTTSGWSPNPVKYSTANSMSGPWSDWTNLVPDSGTTYRSQSAYILPVVGSHTTSYIYLGDRWQGDHLVDSRYIWLPLNLTGTKASMIWDDYWTIDPSTGAYANSPPDTGTVYEAESTANTRHGAVHSQNCTGGSGGHCIGSIGKGSENYLQFNGIHASTAGSHTIRIYYPNNDGNYRTATISLNGATGVNYKFPPTDNIIRSIRINLNLIAGNNTLKFSNNDAYGPDIDRITVSK
jgi:hypothetical protein